MCQVDSLRQQIYNDSYSKDAFDSLSDWTLICSNDKTFLQHLS